MSTATACVRCVTCRTLFPRLVSHRPRLTRITAAPQQHARLTSQHARHLASSASSSTSPPVRPVDTRVDINLTANRPPIDALFATYLQSPSQHTLTPLLATLTIHQHLYQLSSHFRTKLTAASATANLFFSQPANTTATPHPANSNTPTASISYSAVNVQQLEDELLSERIVKTFTIQPTLSPTTTTTTTTTTTATSATSLPIIVESDWRTERNKVRGLGIQSYSMRVLVHIPLTLTAGFPSSLSSAASLVLSSKYASFVLTDCYDSGVGGCDVELVGVLPVLMGMGGLSEAEWVWLMSVLCTYPSDVAFDVLSAALARGDGD